MIVTEEKVSKQSKFHIDKKPVLYNNQVLLRKEPSLFYGIKE